MDTMNTSEKSLVNNKKYEYLIILEGILVGLAAGAVVSLYRYLLAVIFDFALSLYKLADSVPKAVVMFIILIILGIAAGLMVKKRASYFRQRYPSG